MSQVPLGDWYDYHGYFLLAFFLAQYAFIFADRLAFDFDAPFSSPDYFFSVTHAAAASSILPAELRQSCAFRRDSSCGGAAPREVFRMRRLGV